MKQDKVLYFSVVGFGLFFSIGLAIAAYVLSDPGALYYRPARTLSSAEVWENLACILLGLFAFLVFAGTAVGAWYFNPWRKGIEDIYGRRFLSVPRL